VAAAIVVELQTIPDLQRDLSCPAREVGVDAGQTCAIIAPKRVLVHLVLHVENNKRSDCFSAFLLLRFYTFQMMMIQTQCKSWAIDVLGFAGSAQLFMTDLNSV
jgi:hypothetical protein